MEEIFVDVKKCEPKNRVRGANVSIPAEYVAVVYLKKSGTVAAPVALGVVGGVLGFVGGAYMGFRLDDETAAVILSFGSAAGGATAGAMLGREAAKKRVAIAFTAPIR